MSLKNYGGVATSSHNQVPKERFDRVINNSLNKHQSLNEVEDLLNCTLAVFNCTLSEDDKIYIRNKYVEDLVELWLNEVSENVMDMFDINTPSKLIDELSNIQDLEGCSNLGLKTPYNRLIRDHCKGTDFTTTLPEKNYISKFKITVLTFLRLNTANLQGEINFQQCLVKFLKFSKDVPQVCNLFNTSILFESTESKTNYFQTFLHGIINCCVGEGPITQLKTAAERILTQESYIFVECVKGTIENFLKPFVVTESFKEGRKLLEITGEHILASTVLPEIVNRENFHEIEEVRFVQAGVIHINACLIHSLWHGKNIVVYADTVIVSSDKKIIWDVSGRDANTTESHQAGTNEDGVGLKGNEGLSGESGGNILLICNEIENATNWKMVVNGGKGSKGQDGGNGNEGKEGVSIKEFQFKNNFPPPCKFWDSTKIEKLKTIGNSIMKDIKSVEFFILDKLEYFTAEEFKLRFEENTLDLNDMYFEVETETGCKIIFSFYYGPKFTFCQSFLLNKGSDGEPGKDGGRGGLGGKGGCPGDVNIQINQNSELAINEIEICAYKGEDGKPGIPGQPGRPGKSGRDCAYIDSTKMKLPKYFIPLPRDCYRLTVNYHLQSGSDRVYCNHNSRYAEITKVEKSFFHSSNILKRQNVNVTEEGQCDLVQVIRKKTIDTKVILKNYNRKISTANPQKLNEIEQKINQTFNHITDEEEMQKQTEKQSKISRTIAFSHDPVYDLIVLDPSLITSQQDISKDLGNVPMDVEMQKNVTQLHLSLEELRTWRIKSLQSLSLPETEVNNILRNKYQLGITEYLEQKYFDSNEFFKTVNSKSVCLLPHCLIEYKDSHEVQYTKLESFLCEDSDDQRAAFIKDLKSSPDKKFLLETFNRFLNNGHNFLPENKLAMYKKHLDWLKHNKAKKMTRKIIPVLNDFKKDKNCQVYEKLVHAVKDKNFDAKVDVDRYIHGDELLNQLFQIYIEEVKRPLTLKSKLLSEETLIPELEEKIIDDIKNKGALSVFYRELLAQKSDTNIRLYTTDDRNQIMLYNNHNPSSNATTHILMRNNKLFKLKVNDVFCKMNKLHGDKSQLFNKIQLHLASITEVDQFEQFLKDLPFLKNDCIAISKSTEIHLKINHLLLEEENIQSISNYFERDEDRALVIHRLQILKHGYVGYQSTLHYIALSFKCEGNHLTVSQLCCTINFILKLLLESPSKIHLVHWIITAYQQINWMTEFTLLKLELYCKQCLQQEVKNNWRECLNTTNKELLTIFFGKLDKDSSLDSLERVQEVLSLLFHTRFNDTRLHHLCLAEWKYILKDTFWICQLKSIGRWTEDELSTATYYMATLENLVGQNLCNRFIEAVRNHLRHTKAEHETCLVLTTLRNLVTTENLCNQPLMDRLFDEDITKWNNVIEKELFSSNEPRSLKQLNQLIKMSSNTSKVILTQIDEIENCVEKTRSLVNILINKIDEPVLQKFISNLLNIFERNKIPLFNKKSEQEKSIDIQDRHFQRFLEQVKQDFYIESKQIGSENENLNFIKEESQSVSNFLSNNLNEIFLATVCVTIYIINNQNIILRDTQLLAILTFLKASKNMLGQVSTGEGKSYIIISVAIMQALSGCKVDIITSSHVLAKRDASVFKKLCNFFSLDVGHNCSEDLEERKRSYSNCPIVYGELAYFQRDYLLDKVYNKNVLGDRTFETLIVDEVDSMLLDKGNNVLYLSHEIPGLDKLEPLFVYIWKCLNLPLCPNNQEGLLSIDQLKDVILSEMYKQIKIEDISNLDTNLEERYVLQTWSLLQAEEVIDSAGKILQCSESKLDEVAKKCVHKGHIKYLFNKVINRKRAFEIPMYLKPFVETHLEKWIESAINAMSLKVNIDYVVDIDRSVTSTDSDPNIIIVDRDTGTDMTNSHWDQGLHQFLQLKHGCKISPLTFKAVFISNVKYLKQYNTLYGLTGTLGSKSDQDLLKETYKVEFVTIPTAKAKVFKEEIPILCNSYEEWSTQICKEVYNLTAKRSALIICETVNDVLFLKKKFDAYLKNKSLRQVFTYMRDYEKFSIAENLETGHIIISTNLAGRGTDITLSPNLIKAGGLHVCLSYLPNNCRIEEQAFGRAARNGEPGSGQLIFKNVGRSSVSKIFDLKKERDILEVFRISEIKKYYVTKIKLEEEWFTEFQETFGALRNSKHSKHSAEVKSVLIMTCLDQWAMWLERNSNSENIASIKSFISSISQLVDNDFNVWSRQIQDPFQLTKLGLLHLKEEKYKQAIEFFDRVIKDEPVFSEAAYYYRVCARSRNEEIESDIMVKELEIVENKLKERIECSLMSARFIDWLKTSCEKNILQMNSFEEQQKIICETYDIFIGSIQNMIGYPVTPESFFAIGSKPPQGISEEKVSRIIFNDLIKGGIIEQRIKNNISENDLTFLCSFGICPRKVKFMLENCKSTGSKLEEDTLKWLKESTDLPTRELFWNELIYAGILTNQEKIVCINHQSLNEVDPSLSKEIEKIVDVSTTLSEDQIYLYSMEELGQSEESLSIKCFNEKTLEKKVGSKRLKLLQQNGSIKSNRLATVAISACNLNNVKLNYFDSITQEDFSKVGIPPDTAACIIEDLISQKMVFVKEELNQLQYSLTENCADINQIELVSHRAYIDDVKQLLSHHLAFRIALQKLKSVLPLCRGNYTNLFLPLQINLEKRIWYELQENGIIQRKINPEQINSVQDLYPESANKDKFIKIFCDMYDIDRSKKLVEELVKKKWLIHNMIGNNLNINCVESVDKERKQSLLQKLLPLSSIFGGDTETIKLILSNYHYLSNSVEAIKKKLEFLEGRIHTIETPSLFLTALEAKLKQSKIPVSEVNTFALNGFDEIAHLKEKKYTSKMKLNVFYITMLGITEIAAGSILGILSIPLGIYLLKQGIDDIIFVTQCALTGYFSWKDYRLAKLTSLLLSSVSLFKGLSNIGKSSFATQTTGFSITSLKEKSVSLLSGETTLKEKCVSLFSRTKSAVSGIFQREVSNSAKSGEMISQVFKRVLIHTAQGVACGTTLTVIDHTIHSKVEDLGEFLTNMIYSDIDEICTNHRVVSCATELCNKLGTTASLKIIEDSLRNVLSGHQVELDKSFDSIDINIIKTLIERTVSKGFTKKGEDTFVLSEIAETAAKLSTAFVSVKSYFKSISEFVSNVLDILHQKLQTEIISKEKVHKSSTITCSDLEDFKGNVLNIMVMNSKSSLSDHITNKILTPILEMATSCFISYSFKTVGKISKSFLTNEEITKLTSSEKNSFSQEKSKKETDNTNHLFPDFNQISCELLKTRKHKSIMTYKMLMSQNAPMDFYCLEFCFKFIPLALKEEGIKVPSFKLALEENGRKHVFELGDTSQGPVLHISKDKDFISNLKNNKVLVKDVFAFLSKSFLEHDPALNFSATVLQEIFFRAMDNYCDSRGSSCDWEEYTRDSPSSFQQNQLNRESENKTPYEHSHCNGGWKFSSRVDVDLREKDMIVNLNCVQSHIAKGFEAALIKINKHIHVIQERLKTFNLVLDDFSSSKHEIAPPPPDCTSAIFNCCTVQYDLVVPVMLTECDTLVDFAIQLRLENEIPTNKPKPLSPNGPHIFYEISPVSDPKLIDKGLRGHILLNIDCRSTSFSLKDCHRAGELIVASKEIKRTSKECSFVIITDSHFKDIHRHVTLSKCDSDFDVITNRNIRKLKKKITTFLNKHQSVKCVVLFIGNDIIKENKVQANMLAGCIFEVIEKIQKQFENVKIVMYSLLYVKEPAMKNFWKIFHTNNILEVNYKQKNFMLANTNEVIGPEDLARDGIHLKKSGYMKLGKHLSEKCMEIVNLI